MRDTAPQPPAGYVLEPDEPKIPQPPAGYTLEPPSDYSLASPQKKQIFDKQFKQSTGALWNDPKYQMAPRPLPESDGPLARTTTFEERKKLWAETVGSLMDGTTVKPEYQGDNFQTVQAEKKLDFYRKRLALTNNSHLELDEINRDMAEEAANDAWMKSFYEKLGSHPFKSAEEIIFGPVEPVRMSGVKGYPKIAHGIYGAATAKNTAEAFKQGTEAVEGVGEALEPLMYTAGGINPATLVKFTIGQEIASQSAEALFKQLGASPEAQQFIAETSGLLGGLALGIHEHANRSVVLHRDLVRELNQKIYDAPPQYREAAAKVARDTLADIISKRKRVVGPQGEGYKISNKADAEALARKLVDPAARLDAATGERAPIFDKVEEMLGRPIGRSTSPAINQ